MRLPLAQARALLATALLGREQGVERVALDAAWGRRLAVDLPIAHALPGFDQGAFLLAMGSTAKAVRIIATDEYCNPP